MAEFTNVLVTDTFDQWRIKTNNIGADVTALIGTVETDLDGFRTEIGNTISAFETELDTTLANLNIGDVTLAGAQTITGAKTFTASTLFVTNDDADPLIIRRALGSAPDGTFVPIEGTAQSNGVQETQISTNDTGLIFNCINDETFATVKFGLDARDTERATNKGQASKNGAFYITNWGTDGIELHAGTGSGNDIRLNGDNIFNYTGISTTKLTVNSGKMKLNNLDYTWPSGRSGGRYLRTDANGILSWEAVAGGTGDVNVSTLVFNDIVPVGTIMPWAGASEPTDEKWKFCDGKEVLKTAYPDLTTILGGNSPKYGTASDPAKYIKLPNLEQRVPVGAGGGYNVGTTGGSSTASGSISGNTGSSGSGNTGAVTLTAAQSGLPSHTHSLKRRTSSSGSSGDSKFSVSQKPGGNISGPIIANAAADASDSHSHSLPNHSHSLSGSVSTSTLQPYLVTKYIIKVLPDDVQQVSIEAGNGINIKDALNADTDTLDLFSTKIELLADTTQFKFNTGGQLQLVTPAVSQANITSQISTAVTGLATTAAVTSQISTAVTGLAASGAVTSEINTAVTGLATTSYVDTAATAAGKTIRAPVGLELSGTTTTAGFIIVKVSSYESGFSRNRTTKAGYADITADGITYPVQSNYIDGEAMGQIPIRAGATYSIVGNTVTATFIPLS